MITLSSALPYLLVIGGYLLRHFEVGSKLASFLGLAAGPNPLAPVSPPGSQTSPKPSTAHPILSDAVNAAIQQAVKDVTAGHIASLKDELIAVAKSAVAAAVADIKAKG